MSHARAIGLLAALAFLGAVALWAQRALRAHRLERAELLSTSPPESLPKDLSGIEGFREEHWTLADGTRQRALHVPTRDGTLLVVAHGSPGTALGMLPQARALARLGHGLLLLDFPGYGASEGARSWGASYRESVRRAVDFGAAQPGVRAIGGLGFSMGTAVLASAAADDPRLRALVLLAPFTDLLAQRTYERRSRAPGMGIVAVLTARQLGVAVHELDAAKALRRMPGRPLLLVVGDADSAIPVPMVRELASVSTAAEVLVLPGAGHVDVARRVDDAYVHRIHAFYRLHLTAETSAP